MSIVCNDHKRPLLAMVASNVCGCHFPYEHYCSYIAACSPFLYRHHPLYMYVCTLTLARAYNGRNVICGYTHMVCTVAACSPFLYLHHVSILCTLTSAQAYNGRNVVMKSSSSLFPIYSHQYKLLVCYGLFTVGGMCVRYVVES